MTRIRHKKSEMPFADALAAAQKRLKAAQKERDSAKTILHALEIEIPNLENTIRVLQRQLDKMPLQNWNPHTGEVTEQHETIFAVASNPPGFPDVVSVSTEEDALLPEPVGVPLVPE